MFSIKYSLQIYIYFFNYVHCSTEQIKNFALHPLKPQCYNLNENGTLDIKFLIFTYLKRKKTIIYGHTNFIALNVYLVQPRHISTGLYTLGPKTRGFSWKISSPGFISLKFIHLQGPVRHFISIHA